MMSEFISIEKASVCLIDLIHLLRTTDEIVITENQLPIARILRSQTPRPATAPDPSEGTFSNRTTEIDQLAFKDYMP